jgi:hypothetical protein
MNVDAGLAALWQMKTIIPWVLVVALAAGGYFLFSAGKEKDAELEKLRAANQQLEPLRSQVEDLKKQAVAADEVDRLRKDNEDLLRLRNEVGQLRTENKALTTQVQTIQTQRNQAQQQATELNKVAAENNQLRQQTQQFQQIQAQAQLNTCINFLRQIDGAKQQWALENQKPPNAIPTANDLAPYLRNGTAGIVCPSGGTYSINAVNVLPTCTIPGHAIPPRQ